MPVQKIYEALTGDLREGDFVVRCESQPRAAGTRVESLVWGRTRYTVRFDNGKERAFYPDDTFTVERLVETDDEVAARRDDAAARALRNYLDSIQTTKHADILANALAQSIVYLDYQDLTSIIEHQETARWSRYIELQFQRYTAVVPDALMCLKGAFGFVARVSDGRRTRDPLSRSTNPVSNLIDDVTVYVQNEIITTACRRAQLTEAALLAADDYCQAALAAQTRSVA